MLEKYFKNTAEKIAYPFVRICIFFKIKPNTLSFIGLFIVIAGSILVYNDIKEIGLLTLFIGTAIDGLDGPLARVSNQSSDFGGLVDSSVDRIAEMFIWCTFCIKFTTTNMEIMMVFAILTGSFLIPYTRAKAESMHIYENVGITPRPERIIFVLVYMALNLNNIYLYIFTILVWITVSQRMYLLYKKI